MVKTDIIDVNDYLFVAFGLCELIISTFPTDELYSETEVD